MVIISLDYSERENLIGVVSWLLRIINDANCSVQGYVIFALGCYKQVEL